MVTSQKKSAVLAWVVTACAFYAGCRADHGEYRTAGGLINVATNTNPVTTEDANASLQNNEIFRFLINLINLRVRLPADYLLLSRVQVVRVLSNNKDRTDAYSFKDGVPVTLTYKKPNGLADGSVLTLLFMDQEQKTFRYLKPGEQLKIIDNGDTLDMQFTAEKSVFIVMLVQLVGTPNPANAWVPNVEGRPATFGDFIANQTELFHAILEFSGPVAGTTNTVTKTADGTGTGTTTGTSSATDTAMGTNTVTATNTTTASTSNTGTTTATNSNTATAATATVDTATATSSTTATSISLPDSSNEASTKTTTATSATQAQTQQ